MPRYNGSDTAAGVYGGEEDNSFSPSSTYPSTGAIVGASNRGPVGVPTRVTSKNEFRRRFGRRNAQLTFAHFCAERFLTRANSLWFYRPDNESNYGSFRVRMIDGFSLPVASTTGYLNPDDFGFEPEEILFIYGANPGSWNNNIRVNMYPDVNDLENELFIVDVYEDNYSVPVESYRCTLRERVINGVQMNIEYQLLNADSRIRARVNRDNPQYEVDDSVRLINAILSADLTHGDDGRPFTDADIINGWEEFDNPDDYDIRLLINAGYATPAVQIAMVQLAESRRDCFAILDTPANMQSAAQAVNYRRNILNLNSSFGAIYCNDILEVTDEGQKIYVPSSGAIASAYAYTDTVASLWFAPAGVERGVIENIEGIRVKYDLGQRNMLDQNQVNYIHKFSGYGYCIWGAQTLQSQKSALQDINVRRLVNHIETTAKYDALVGVYEPNDPILWEELKNTVDKILRPIKAGRGLYAYGVQCDEKLNTPDIIADGDVILVYMIQPTRYAKRILFTTTVAATGQLSTAVEFVTNTAA